MFRLELSILESWESGATPHGSLYVAGALIVSLGHGFSLVDPSMVKFWCVDITKMWVIPTGTMIIIHLRYLRMGKQHFQVRKINLEFASHWWYTMKFHDISILVPPCWWLTMVHLSIFLTAPPRALCQVTVALPLPSERAIDQISASPMERSDGKIQHFSWVNHHEKKGQIVASAVRLPEGMCENPLKHGWTGVLNFFRMGLYILDSYGWNSHLFNHKRIHFSFKQATPGLGQVYPPPARKAQVGWNWYQLSALKWLCVLKTSLWPWDFFCAHIFLKIFPILSLQVASPMLLYDRRNCTMSFGCSLKVTLKVIASPFLRGQRFGRFHQANGPSGAFKYVQ